MGGNARIKGLIVGAAVVASAPSLFAATQGKSLSPSTIEAIRSEINSLEKDLLASRESQSSASTQLKKIRKLLMLEQKEIGLSRKKINEMSESLGDLSKQKQSLQENIEKQKISLKVRLRELNRLTQSEALDAHWLSGIETENSKTYFLSKVLKKDLTSVDRLRQDVVEAQNLELRMIEEKNKLDYYVQELQSQMTMLGANEEVQKEIIRTNRSNRLDRLARMRSLRESEHEVELMIAGLRKEQKERAETRGGSSVSQSLQTPPATKKPILTTPSVGLASVKGKLPLPVEGQVLSAFGKSYNSQTNLLTFQKGITFGSQPSSEVKAVSDGKVVFAGPLKNYGLITIVEHPGQYYTLYGQMGNVAVSEGAEVHQGDVLGKTANDPFYFEIRNKNVAINPLQWISTDSVKLTKK